MSYIKINNIEFDSKVAILEYKRSFNVLDGPNAGRAMNGDMIRDVIGTYIGHTIKFTRRGSNYAGLDELWDYLLEHSVDNSVLLEVADGQATLSYHAYYTSATQGIQQVSDGVNYWDELEVTFVPMTAQIVPA